MQKSLRSSPRNLIGPGPRTKAETKDDAGNLEREADNYGIENAGLESTSLSPLQLFPGASFSMLFRLLLVSRICRRRMVLFCQKNYALEPNLLLILMAASEGHLQQGALARSLGINKNAMVFLIDNLELLRLIKRIANPDNRREKLIECTFKGRLIVAEVKTNYPQIVRWGLYPLTDAQVEQFGTLLKQIIDGESSAKPPLLRIHSKKTQLSRTVIAASAGIVHPNG